jgi:hypothetical protein
VLRFVDLSKHVSHLVVFSEDLREVHQGMGPRLTLGQATAAAFLDADWQLDTIFGLVANSDKFLG